MLKTTPRFLTSVLATSIALALTACSGSDDKAPTAETGSLSGSVLNSPTPVGGVKVTATGPGGTFRTTTSSSGTYSIDSVPVGSYTIDFCGQGVFDSNGDPIADKINLHLPSNNVTSGGSDQKPAFLPEKALGLTVETGGTLEGTIPAGTLIQNAGTTIFFAEETTVTFLDANDTTISITPVPAEQIPVALPNGLAASALVAIEPAGATFDVRPEISFTNGGAFPDGSLGVQIFRLNYSSGTWIASGTGSVAANGGLILSDAGEGLRASGWHAIVVETFCETDLVGNVISDTGAPIEGALVTALNGATATTNSLGEFTLTGVPLPSDGFNVVVTVVAPASAGFVPNESNAIMGQCGTETQMGFIELTSSPTDAVAPTVSATVPADGALDVADNVAPSVTFSEAMSPGSLNADTLRVFAGSTAVDGQIGIATNGGQTTATFVPAESLPLETEIRFQISANVMDAAGNRLGATTSSAFTTAADSDGGSTTIAITPSTPAAILPGATTSLTAAVVDAAGQAVDGALVEWSSDSSSVDVDATGEVFAITPGMATVRASFGGTFAEVTITVNTPAIDSVTLTGDESVIAAGSSMALVAIARDSGSAPLNGFQFQWTSNDEAAATVNAAGVVRALSAGGPVTITATEPNSSLSASFALTIVDPSTVATVEVVADADAIGPGASVQLSASASDSSNETVPGVSFTWESSDPSIATVTSTGIVSSVGSGPVQITATANGSTAIAGTADIDVYPFEPTVIRFVSANGDSELYFMSAVLQDAETGQVLDQEFSEYSDSVDFGFVDAERVNVTYFGDSATAESQVGFIPARLTSVMNVPSGRMTLTYDYGIEDDVSVDASFPLGATTLAASAGDSVEGSMEIIEGVQSPEFFYVPKRSYGPSSVLAVAYDDAAGSGILSGGFAAETFSDGAELSITMTAAAVTTVPFSAGEEVLFAGSRFMSEGLMYLQPSGVFTPAEFGNIAFVAPDGADRFGHRFEIQDPVSFARIGRELRSNAAASTLTVGLPSVQLSDVALDTETDTLSWSMSGSSASAFDVGHAQIYGEYNFLGSVGSPSVTWDFYFPAATSSLVVPQGKGLPGLDLSNMRYSVEMYDQAGVSGYDAFLGRFLEADGAFNVAGFEQGARMDYAIAEKARFEFNVSGASLGTVQYDTGEGLVEVNPGDVVDMPIGTSVTIVATATGLGAVVNTLSANQGETTGVGTTTATLTIESTQSADQVFVSFVAN